MKLGLDCRDLLKVVLFGGNTAGFCHSHLRQLANRLGGLQMPFEATTSIAVAYVCASSASRPRSRNRPTARVCSAAVCTSIASLFAEENSARMRGSIPLSDMTPLFIGRQHPGAVGQQNASGPAG